MHISERVRELPKQEIAKLIQIAAEEPSVLSLGPGEPDFDLPNPLKTTLAKLAKQPHRNHYGPPQGFLPLREAISRKVRKQNKIRWAKPENVVVTTGSQEAILLASACALDATEGMLLPNPSFLAFLPALELLDIAPNYFPLREESAFEPDPDDVEKAIIPGKTQALLINTPANPTGNVISKKVLEQLADIAIEHDLYIFSDEAYEELVYDDAKHVSAASLNGMADHTVTFQSFSKSHAMAGFRLGYAIVPEELARLMTRIHVYNTIAAPTMSQWLGLAALKLPRKHVEGMRKEYNRRRKVIVPRLNDMGLSTPEPKGAFYSFSNIKPFAKNAHRFAFDLLKKQKVAVVPGSEFGTAGEGYIRCSYATALPIIEKALDRMEKFLKTYKPKGIRKARRLPR